MTNLPEGAILEISLDDTESKNWDKKDKVVLCHHSFKTLLEPSNKRLPSGGYVVKVVVSPQKQKDVEVIKALGPNGENIVYVRNMKLIFNEKDKQNVITAEAGIIIPSEEKLKMKKEFKKLIAKTGKDLYSLFMFLEENYFLHQEEFDRSKRNSFIMEWSAKLELAKGNIPQLKELKDNLKHLKPDKAYLSCAVDYSTVLCIRD